MTNLDIFENPKRATTSFVAQVITPGQPTFFGGLNLSKLPKDTYEKHCNGEYIAQQDVLYAVQQQYPQYQGLTVEQVLIILRPQK